eukprot:gene22520-26999_t
MGASSSKPHHEVVIIGGGIAGLHTAFRLIEAGITDIKLYEGRGALGGRVQTTKNKDGKVLFNDFAWRIGEGNKRMLALAEELGVELREQKSVASAKHEPRGSHCESCADDSSATRAESHTTPDG